MKTYIPSEKTLVEMGFTKNNAFNKFELQLEGNYYSLCFYPNDTYKWSLWHEYNDGVSSHAIFPCSKAHLESIILAFKKPQVCSD